MNPMYSMDSICDNAATQSILKDVGLRAYRVTWEDTGRTPGSCSGRNIVDVRLTTTFHNFAPMVRTSNFEDKTHDVSVDAYCVVVDGKHVPLRTYLKEIGMWNDRDETVLATTQTAVIPATAGGTEYTPEVKSYTGNASVVLSCHLGTSAHALHSTAFKQLYHIVDGKQFRLKATSVAEQRGQATATTHADLDADERMRNLALIIVIPTKKPVMRCAPRDDYDDDYLSFESSHPGPMMLGLGSPQATFGARTRGLDMATISAGSSCGQARPSETLKRDPTLPIRVVAQFVRVLDRPELTEAEAADIAAQHARILTVSKAYGSLVVGSSDRPTAPTQPAQAATPAQATSAATIRSLARFY